MITLITMIIKTQIYDNHLMRRLMVSARTWCTEVARLLVDLRCHCYQYLVCWFFIIFIFVIAITITIARTMIMIILLILSEPDG